MFRTQYILGCLLSLTLSFSFFQASGWSGLDYASDEDLIKQLSESKDGEIRKRQIQRELLWRKCVPSWIRR